MVLYATPMVALIPFILSMMGLAAPQGAGGVSVRGVSGALPTRSRARVDQAGDDRSRALVPLERMGAVARGDGALHAALYDDRRAPAPSARDWSAWWRRNSFCRSTGLGQLIMTASQNFDTAGVFASVLVIALIGIGHDAARALAIEMPFRALAELMSTSSATPLRAAAPPRRRAKSLHARTPSGRV